MKQIEKDVLAKMSKVFKRDGSRKFCGRVACMELIASAMEYHKEQYKSEGGNLSLYNPPDYGNLKTGCIYNEKNLLSLRAELFVTQRKERFLRLMKTAFNSDGEYRNTKSSVCRKLIKAANKLDLALYEKEQLSLDKKMEYQLPYYGDVETGELNDLELFELYSRL